MPDMPQDVKDIKRLTSCKTQDGTFFKECWLPQGWPSTEYATWATERKSFTTKL